MISFSDVVAVYVVTDDDWSREDVPGIEALWYPDEVHPTGSAHLVRVSYLYVRFTGWVLRDRLRPRDARAAELLRSLDAPKSDVEGPRRAS